MGGLPSCHGHASDAWNKFGQVVSSKCVHAEAMFLCLFILVLGAVALCGTGAGQLPVALGAQRQHLAKSVCMAGMELWVPPPVVKFGCLIHD